MGRKKRLQFDFTPDAATALKALAKETGAASMADVVKRALALYQHLGPAIRRGAEVVIREPDGRETQVILARF